MKRVIKKMLKGVLACFGVHLRRVDPSENNNDWWRDYRIETVVDVGANTGQFARKIRALIPGAFIHSFEPLADCYDQLRRNMEGMPACQAHNFALGDEDGEMEINRNDFSPSSSLLPIGKVSVDAFPHTSRSVPETVQVRRLDAMAKEIELSGNLLVKIDVQGYEDRVISGGRETLSKAVLIVVETSFEELYEGQPLFDDIYSALRALGFRYAGSIHQLKSPSNGRVLQSDALFKKC